MIACLAFAAFEFDEPKRKGGANLHGLATDCTTCGGHRMVVVNVRIPVTSGWMSKRGLKGKGEVEEYAPCPSCNAEANTLRQGFRSPDPALVRAELNR